MKRQAKKTIISTVFALVAFAGNSVLCRLALGDTSVDGGEIDAASFTSIRLLSGTVVLALIVSMSSGQKAASAKGSWLASFMLFLYAVSFSFGYISLDTGTGALILFATVQFTMIFVNLLSGNKLHYSEWLGLMIAFLGFVYFVLPSLTSPSLKGSVLMIISGISWAFYTLKGRGSKVPLSDTAYNFIRTTPMLIILTLVTYENALLSQQGVIFAVTSGAITSGIGYVVWYSALNGLTVTQTAIVQLCVPIIAAIGGVLFANEVITLQLVISALLILGGILIVVLGRSYFVHSELPTIEQGK